MMPELRKRTSWAGESEKQERAHAFLRHQRAISLVSYALLLGLIAIVAILALRGVGEEVTALFGGVAGQMENASSGVSPGSGGSGNGEDTTDPHPACVAEGVGTVCDDGTIFAGFTQAYDQGDTDITGPQTPFFARRCDLGMSWDDEEEECTGTRATMTWNDGTDGWLNTPLDNCTGASGGFCTGVTVVGDEEPWNVGWDGQANTLDAMVGLVNTDSSTAAGNNPHVAAEECAALGAGWYLPAVNELWLLWEARNTGAFAGTYDLSGDNTGRYWSSVEENQTWVWNQNFNDGDQYSNGKFNSRAVRCVRR